MFSNEKTRELHKKKDYGRYPIMQTNDPTSPNLDQIKDKFDRFLTAENSKVIVTDVSGRQNKNYRCAVYTGSTVSLLEKTPQSTLNFEFDFTTQTLNSPYDNEPTGQLQRFTERLGELIEKAIVGKATVVKK